MTGDLPPCTKRLTRSEIYKTSPWPPNTLSSEKAELLGLSGLSAANITVGISGGGSASCEDFSTVNTSISIDLEYGNYPLQVGSL